MTWNMICECDECGALLADYVINKVQENETIRAGGGYTYGGKHLCAECNTEVNRRKIVKEAKDKC